MPDSGRQTPSDLGHRSRLLRSAGTVGGLTLVSRLFGYLRDMVVAALLGTSMVADAWYAAFEFPNTLRRLASEGNLSAAFVPVFAHASRQRNEREVWLLADRFHTAVLLVVASLTVAGILAAPWVVPLVYPGFAETAGKIEITVRLTRLVFVYALFISLSAVLMSVLNARERFAAAAFTPVLLNVAIIVFGVIAWWMGGPSAVYFIVAGVILGGLCQWLFLVPPARRVGMRFRFLPDFRDPTLREVGRLIVPRLFGVGIVQVNIVVGRMLASRLGDGNVSALYFASRITELTLGVFAVAVATVVLPAISRQGAAADHRAMRETLGFALRQVTAITLPATVGLVMLRHDIVAVLFERGQFDARSTTLAAAGLGGYAIGLVAVAAVRIVAPGFYALRETRTPVAVAAVAMVANIVGCLVLMGPLGLAGIALANSLSAVLSAGLLLWLLRARLGNLDGRALMASFGRILIAAGLMGWAVRGVRWWVNNTAGGGLGPALSLLVAIVVGVLTYLAALAVLRAPEMHELRSIFRGSLPGRLDGQPKQGQEGDGDASE